MELNENANLDTSQVEDLRGSGGGGGRGGFGGGGIPIPLPSSGGGWLGIILTLVVLVGGAIFGGANLMGGDGGSQQGDNTNLEQKCAASNPNRFQEVDCRNLLYVNSVQAYWRVALPQSFGQQYQAAETNFFSGQVSTGCGAADSGVGPFYCPPDREIYIDLTFYQELANRFGASGEFAAPYVIAHEYGHHVQTLLGTSDQVNRAQQRDPANANRYSVLLELQADCFAGTWAKAATTTTDAGGQPLFKSITDADVQEAIEAAEAIGDDSIQEKAGMRVNPDKFTHGTSAQRKEWFLRGQQTGDPKQCDTFGNG
jgi:predicted metalloprotease